MKQEGVYSSDETFRHYGWKRRVAYGHPVTKKRNKKSKNMEATRNYYNTTGENAQTVMEFSKKNHAQDKRLLNVFQANPRVAYGGSDFTRIFQNMVLTSIRRALNTLEKDGHILKTGTKQISIFNRPEYLYRYKK